MSASSEVDGSDESDEGSDKASKLPLILGFILALAGGAGGFLATTMGLLPFGSKGENDASDTPSELILISEDVAFVSLDPINVTLPPGSGRSLLRLSIELDVAPQNAAAVEAIKPRVTDILNTYLHALQVSDLESPSALLWLRTQLLHRVQVVAGPGIIRDLLITEFILN